MWVAAAPTMIVILMLGGTQLVMLGIIGEYLWRSFNETRKLPNFVVERRLGPDTIEASAEHRGR